MAQDTGDAGLPNVPVYLDVNNNKALDVLSGASAFNAKDSFPLAIPDFSSSNPQSASSTIAVSGVAGIAHLTVNMSIDHTWDSDLTATLTNPSGTTITLFGKVGASGHNFTNTTFDDAAGTPIGSGSAPFSGSYQPQQSLSTFSTQDANGTWTLKVTDGASGDLGTLLEWSMSISAYAEPARLTNASGQYSFSNLSAGSYTVREVIPTGYQVVSPAGGTSSWNLSALGSATANLANGLIPATLQGTVFFDANQNGVQDAGEPGQAGVTMFLDANGNGVPDAGEMTTVTDSRGRYTFSIQVANQIFTVREVTPTGATPTGTMTPAIQTGTNVNVSRMAGSQTESAVAIDPTNPGHVFVLSNTTYGGGLFGSYTLDGGRTWSSRNFATGSDGLTAACCDGSLSYDSFGNLFLTYVDAPVQHVVVAVSSDGGQSFQQLTTFGSPIDQPTITTGPGSVWVVYNHSGVPTVSHAAVMGKGVAYVSPFSSPMGLSEPGGISGNFGDIAVGPDGQVAVAYQNAGSGSGPDKIYLNVSTNGSTFGSYVLATNTNVGAFNKLPAQSSRSVDAEVGLGFDRSSGPHRGRLYMVYTDAPASGSEDTNIFVRYSDDTGTTWSTPVQVNDDQTSNSQFLPKIAVDPSTGNVAVSFYDARDSASNTSAGYYVSISTDGGQTFLLNKRLSAGISKAPLDSFNFGDYSGMAFSGGTVWAAWGDNSDSTGDNGGSLDLMVNSASLTSFNGFELHVSAGQTETGLDFGNYRAAAPQFVVDDFLYPFSVTGPYWNKTTLSGSYRGTAHVHTQGLAENATNTSQWVLPRPAGSYEVFVNWTASPINATNATYSIYDGPVLITTVRVNQTVNPSDASYGGVLWKSLGTYYTSYSALVVVLSSQANGNVVADAAMACLPLSGKSSDSSVPSMAKLSTDITVLAPTVTVEVPDMMSTSLVSGTYSSTGVFPEKLSASTLSQALVATVSPSVPYNPVSASPLMLLSPPVPDPSLESSPEPAQSTVSLPVAQSVASSRSLSSDPVPTASAVMFTESLPESAVPVIPASLVVPTVSLPAFAPPTIPTPTPTLSLPVPQIPDDAWIGSTFFQIAPPSPRLRLSLFDV